MRRNSKLAYLAGMIDGDGSISISIIKRKDYNGYSFQPNLVIGCTSRKVCNWAKLHFGGNLYRYEQEGRLPMYHWKMYGREKLTKLVEELKPFLFIKKPQSQVLSEYFALGKSFEQEKRMEIARKIQWTNKNHESFPEPKRNLTTKDMSAYIAGLLDAEGGIGVRKSGESIASYITISNSNYRVINWINSNFKANINLQENANGSKDVHVWTLYKKEDSEKFLLSVIPYLIEKREHAITLLDFVKMENKWNKKKREAIFYKLAGMQLRTRGERQRLHAEASIGKI